MQDFVSDFRAGTDKKIGKTSIVLDDNPEEHVVGSRTNPYRRHEGLQRSQIAYAKRERPGKVWVEHRKTDYVIMPDDGSVKHDAIEATC